ncbi:hypothetical protein [Aeromicrobium ginsengisoli]|uniref:Uncharacterized protein n=1 Tax=Aeromicrobium ginsengisoli TaxID=363867 RepID=A0A5M4FAI2_9ACTN|nr:hypothetical protein [Aeromicrobium ginsengisoli]KAA1395351.1 hypothetical protein ESP70_014405 [Aeromicrobium ginsengisoli]
MKQQIAAGILAISMVGGVGTGVVAHQLKPDPKADPRTTPSATATTKKTDKPKSTKTANPPPGTGGRTKTSEPPKLPLAPVGALRIIPGAVGPVRVGMSKQDAYATGYFDADVSVPACNRTDDLAWKAGYSDQLDVHTNDDGSVSAIGIRGAGPRTRSGLGVGSTYESVQGVLGQVAPEAAGFDQTGLFVSEGAGWIGFLFNATPDAVAPTDTVTFVEVTSGERPGLTRSGC